MIVTNEPHITREFISLQGWGLSLPEGWEPMTLSKSQGETLNGGSSPIVFWSGVDPTVSITWTRSNRPISSSGWTTYCTATMLCGPIGSREAAVSIEDVCPVIGTIIEAEVVRLPDGNKALELIDEVKDDVTGLVIKQGLHLILPMKMTEPGPLYMQRLMFYGEAARFKHLLPQLRKCMRSFNYK